MGRDIRIWAHFWEMHKGMAAIHCGRSEISPERSEPRMRSLEGYALVVVATGSQSIFGRNKLRTSSAMYDGEGEV